MSDAVISVTTKAVTSEPSRESSYDKVAGVAGLLGINNPSDDERTQLIKIGDYYRSQSKELSEIDLLNKVRQLELRLGLPEIGESRLERLYRYVALQRQIDQATGEQARLMK